MELELKDLLDDLTALRDNLVYDLSITEFKNNKKCIELENKINFYKEMIHNIDVLISKYS